MPTATQRACGQNIITDIKDGILTITIDLNKEYGLSKSKKTIRIASTGGNVRMQDDQDQEFVMGINVYKPKPDNYKEEGEEG